MFVLKGKEDVILVVLGYVNRFVCGKIDLNFKFFEGICLYMRSIFIYRFMRIRIILIRLVCSEKCLYMCII